MAWFSRKSGPSDEVTARGGTAYPPAASSASAAAVPSSAGDDIPLRPVIERPGVEEQQRIATGLQALESEGVDLDDLQALGAGFDAALAQWLGTPRRQRDGHEVVVERYAIGIGEHLVRHTDLSWALVTDAFGTDLAVAETRDEFVVVPANLVASRWLNQESGWIPGVVGHLVRLRTSR